MARWVVAAAMMTAAMVASPARTLEVDGGSFKIAQGSSCQSWYNNCATRCRTRLPNDKNCVSDHCSPKLATCRQSGCWQEGKAYGGGKHCGLAK